MKTNTQIDYAEHRATMRSSAMQMRSYTQPSRFTGSGGADWFNHSMAMAAAALANAKTYSRWTNETKKQTEAR